MVFFLRALWRVRKNAKGQGALEFSLGFIIILAFIFLLVDVAIATFAWGVLQYSVTRGTREMRQSASPAAIAAAIETHAEGIGLDIQPGEIQVVVGANTTTVTANVSVELQALGVFWTRFIANTGNAVNVVVQETITRRVTNLSE